MARYGLARHVFVCRDEEFIVVLDLKQDRYFALEAAKMAALGGVLPGWPVTAPDHTPSESEIEAAAEPLRKQGWLLDVSVDTKEATPTRVRPPQAELAGESELGAVRLGPRAIAAFVGASVFAKFALRFWRFERVIQRVAARNAKHAVAAGPFDFERARQLMDAFGRMRLFLFSARQECLHDSLAVLEFLARHDVFPSWVFAVRARPFAAHCWVQYDDVVCNDSVEQVSSYVPIMTV
jgi:hypothetical protein